MNNLGKKIIIVINGKGSSGKDTICEIVGKYYNVSVISEISPIKEIAKLAGWNGEKDDKSRKMLADLKAVFISYNNLPYNYAMQEIQKFSDSSHEILFIHIREKEEILKIINNSPIQVFTLLVKRLDQEFSDRVYGNDADDCVGDFNYDFYYMSNNINICELEQSFMSFFNSEMLPIIMNKNVVYDKVNNEFLYAHGKRLGIANLMWHITGECNLFCDFCFSKKSKNKFDISKLEQYINIFKDLGVQKIDLSGGEPLLFSNLNELCIALKENDIPFTITSSGFVGEDRLNWLVTNRDLFARIILSINAPSASIQENINHGRGSYNKVCDLAHKLMKLNARLRINTVCTEKICNEKSIKDFVELVNSISPLEWCLIQDYNLDEEIANKIHDDFFQGVNHQSLFSKIKLISRSKKMYENYYVLDENGFLYLRGKEDKRMLIESINIKKFLEENYQ